MQSAIAHWAIAAGDRRCRPIEITCVAVGGPEAGRAEAARLFGRCSTDVKRASAPGLRDRTGDIHWTSW